MTGTEQKEITILVNGKPVYWATRSDQVTVSIDGSEPYKLAVSEKKPAARLEKS